MLERKSGLLSVLCTAAGGAAEVGNLSAKLSYLGGWMTDKM